LRISQGTPWLNAGLGINGEQDAAGHVTTAGDSAVEAVEARRAFIRSLIE
jgi:hypothetical protein